MLDIVYGPILFCIGISPNLCNPNSFAKHRRPTLTHGFEWLLRKNKSGIVMPALRLFAGKLTLEEYAANLSNLISGGTFHASKL